MGLCDGLHGRFLLFGGGGEGGDVVYLGGRGGMPNERVIDRSVDEGEEEGRRRRADSAYVHGRRVQFSLDPTDLRGAGLGGRGGAVSRVCGMGFSACVLSCLCLATVIYDRREEVVVVGGDGWLAGQYSIVSTNSVCLFVLLCSILLYSTLLTLLTLLY